jgi:hypothetical protein
MTKIVNFTPEMRDGLRAAYDKACAKEHDHRTVFVFDGNEYLVGYAKYLLEYLDNAFKQGRR